MPYKNVEDKREHEREYRRKNRTRIRANYVKNREKNIERYRGYQRKANAKYSKRHPDSIKRKHQRYTAKRREKILGIISRGSNPICIRCGCSDTRFLEINHKNGGGGKETRGSGKRQEFENSILSGTRPIDDLELLCRACNAIHFLELKFGAIPMKVIWNKQ